MPVTLKLSKKFYETFGEQVTNELVDAFNQVDATYRSDLKDMNESNFARSDAKQELRFAQFEQRFAQFEARAEARFARFEERFARFEAKWDTQFATFKADSDARFAKFETQMERSFNAQSRFMLLGWGTVLAAISAGILALK